MKIILLGGKANSGKDSAAEYIRMIHISRYKTVISSQCFLKKMEAALSLVGGVWKVYQTWKALEEQPTTWAIYNSTYGM